MSKRCFAPFKVCTETIENSKHHLLKSNRSQYVAILSNSWKGVQQASSSHNRTKNKLEKFAISYTNIWLNFILILYRILNKQP